MNLKQPKTTNRPRLNRGLAPVKKSPENALEAGPVN
jgi:hypothetical protein